MGVTALGMDVCCEASGHQVTPIMPNVCITPAAPSPLPIPYPIMGTTSSLDPGCEDTRIEGKKSMSTKSEVAAVHGNEAGTQKDIITGKTGGKAWAVLGAPTVFFEGGLLVITGMPGFGNTM
jgi:hypothetical protein